jgi:hypothetical protein
MLKFVPEERSVEFLQSYESARKKSIAYMKGSADLN